MKEMFKQSEKFYLDYIVRVRAIISIKHSEKISGLFLNFIVRVRTEICLIQNKKS